MMSGIVLRSLILGVVIWSRSDANRGQKALSARLPSYGTYADHPVAPVDYFTSAQLRKPQNLVDRVVCDVTVAEYCADPGPTYPRADIGFFIDENRSLMKRMFGSVSSRNLRRDEEDASLNSDLRKKRQAKPQALTTYLCPVEEELVTPFWALNGTGVKLAIVNSPPFEQAIHTVKCARGQANARCHPTRPCMCSQEYSWFRLLAYDPTDNCKGIFMDWFKFPSHCACKCLQGSQVLQETAPASGPPGQ